MADVSKPSSGANSTRVVEGVVVQPSSTHASTSGVVMGTVMEGGAMNSAPPPAPSANDTKTTDGKDEGILFVQHAVECDDNISTLAIRYGSTVDGIMRANHLLTRDLDLLPKGCVLQIPRTHEKPLGDAQVPSSEALSRHALEERDRLRRRIVRDFSQTHGCSMDEAAFYLDDHNYDVANATRARHDDVHWEQSSSGRDAKKQFKKMLRNNGQ
jgi:LysM repeat protein